MEQCVRSPPTEVLCRGPSVVTRLEVCRHTTVAAEAVRFQMCGLFGSIARARASRRPPFFASAALAVGDENCPIRSNSNGLGRSSPPLKSVWFSPPFPKSDCIGPPHGLYAESAKLAIFTRRSAVSNDDRSCRSSCLRFRLLGRPHPNGGSSWS